MRVVLQRVSSANVTVEGRQSGRIDSGLLALVGVGRDDDRSDVSYVADRYETFVYLTMPTEG